MRTTTSILIVIGLLMCLCLPLGKAGTGLSSSNGNPSLPSSTNLNLGTATADVNDSDEFLRNAIRSRDAGQDYSQKIDALLKRMTVDEKVGQMTQLTLEMVVTGHDQNVQVDRAKLQKAINRYGVGSILNCYNQALTPDKWQEIITEIQKAARSTRLGIPVIYGIDSIHGANYVQGATLFPQEIGMAATWNPQLMQRSAEISASETARTSRWSNLESLK